MIITILFSLTMQTWAAPVERGDTETATTCYTEEAGHADYKNMDGYKKLSESALAACKKGNKSLCCEYLYAYANEVEYKAKVHSPTTGACYSQITVTTQTLYRNTEFYKDYCHNRELLTETEFKAFKRGDKSLGMKCMAEDFTAPEEIAPRNNKNELEISLDLTCTISGMKWQINETICTYIHATNFEVLTPQIKAKIRNSILADNVNLASCHTDGEFKPSTPTNAKPAAAGK